MGSITKLLSYMFQTSAAIMLEEMNEESLGKLVWIDHNIVWKPLVDSITNEASRPWHVACIAQVMYTWITRQSSWMNPKNIIATAMAQEQMNTNGAELDRSYRAPNDAPWVELRGTHY